MIKRLFLFILPVAVLFGCQDTKVAESRNPEYPLYSPYFGTSHQFSGEDLNRIAGYFDFVYGQSLTRKEMDSVRAINQKVQFIQYVNLSSISSAEAEKKMKRNIIYYPFSTLGEEINKSSVIFRIDPFPGNDTILLKASTTNESVTKNSKEYVVWIRIGDEMMKVVQWNPKTNIVRVERNYDGIGLSDHRKGDISCLPVYKVAPDNNDMYGDPSNISYHYDPVSSARWDEIYSNLRQFVNIGGDGIWIDILSDGCFGANDIAGKSLSVKTANNSPGLNSYWNFETDSFYRRDDYRKYNEKGIAYLQEKFTKEFRRPAIIYGNNLQVAKFEPGIGGCKYYLMPTDIKPVPLDGMCIEDFMGGYNENDWIRYRKTKEFFAPVKACYKCPKQYKNWVLNLQMLMKCSQSGLVAIPLIINAGMKTAQFEGIPRAQRHEWELWAYASYLLGVEKKDGNCPTKLGIPMFYIENGKRFVDLDPIYFLKIGEPVETNTPDQIMNYKLEGTEVFSRKFSGGTVLVNPSEDVFTIRLERPLLDPDSGEKKSEITMAPKSGRILLEKL